MTCPDDPARCDEIDRDLAALRREAELEVWREIDLLARDDLPDIYGAFSLSRAGRKPVEVYARPISRMVMIVSVDRRRSDGRAMFHGLCERRDALTAAEALVRRDLQLDHDIREDRGWMQET